MEQMYAGDVRDQHDRLCKLEHRLQKHRSSMIQNLNLMMYDQYYAEMEQFDEISDRYGRESKMFKQAIQSTIANTTTNPVNVTATPTDSNNAPLIDTQLVPDNAINVSTTSNGVYSHTMSPHDQRQVVSGQQQSTQNMNTVPNSSREFAPQNPVNYGFDDEAKDPTQNMANHRGTHDLNGYDRNPSTMNTVTNHRDHNGVTHSRDVGTLRDDVHIVHDVNVHTVSVQGVQGQDAQPKLSELYPPERTQPVPRRATKPPVRSSTSSMSSIPPEVRSPPSSTMKSSPSRGPPLPRVKAMNPRGNTLNSMNSKPLDTMPSVTKNAGNPVNPGNGSSANPVLLPPLGRPAVPRSLLKVKRSVYKYGGRGFAVWRKNMQRPMYTTTNLRVNKTFKGNERLARKWMVEKAGFNEREIEGVTFVDRSNSTRGGSAGDSSRGGRGRGGRGGTDRNGKDKFTLIRVRSSLRDIFASIARLDNDPELKKGLMTKQNNRSRTIGDRDPNRKLYVNNFDILDAQCHRKLTSMFLEFGDLEQDIWIDRDRQQNPFAVVYFRSLGAAKKCWNEHNDKSKTPLFFPTKKEMDRDKKGYLNRRLHIEYNREENAANGRARGRPRGRGRGRGRGR